MGGHGPKRGKLLSNPSHFGGPGVGPFLRNTTLSIGLACLALSVPNSRCATGGVSLGFCASECLEVTNCQAF